MEIIIFLFELANKYSSLRAYFTEVIINVTKILIALVYLKKNILVCLPLNLNKNLLSMIWKF